MHRAIGQGPDGIKNELWTLQVAGDRRGQSGPGGSALRNRHVSALPTRKAIGNSPPEERREDRSIGRRRSALNGGHHDALLVGKQVVEDSVIANTPAPSGVLQALDVAAERVLLHSVE